MEPKKTVKKSYDAIANLYLESRSGKTADLLVLDEFIRNLPGEARVLDAGCGAGIPVSKSLSDHFDVTGVDFSEVQIELAKRNVPGATFFCQDMTKLDFPAGSFDGICSFYAIIHIPREEHRALLENFYHMLKPGGLTLLCLGAEGLPEQIEEDFHGQRMYWSHYDAAMYMSMLEQVGFHILLSRIVPDELYGGEHLFVIAQKENPPR
jgi:SAM-dependent methyltransferase